MIECAPVIIWYLPTSQCSSPARRRAVDTFSESRSRIRGSLIVASTLKWNVMGHSRDIRSSISWHPATASKEALRREKRGRLSHLLHRPQAALHRPLATTDIAEICDRYGNRMTVNRPIRD